MPECTRCWQSLIHTCKEIDMNPKEVSDDCLVDMGYELYDALLYEAI